MHLLLGLVLILGTAHGVWTAGTRPDSASQKAVSLTREGARILEENALDAARGKLEEALKLNPRLADAHYFLGVLLEQKGELSSAAAAYGNALRCSPGMAEAHDRLGFVLRQERKTRDAVREFEAAVGLKPSFFDLAPDLPMAHYQFALALQMAGREEEEERIQFEEAHRLAPNFKARK